jgi:hypothetical protein
MPSPLSEDCWIAASMALTLGGLIVGAWRAEPVSFGITAVGVTGLLFVGWRLTHSQRFGWLLLFGLVGLELWADWVQVVYFRSLVYTEFEIRDPNGYVLVFAERLSTPSRNARSRERR